MRRSLLVVPLLALLVGCSQTGGQEGQVSGRADERTADPYRGDAAPLGANALTPEALAAQIGCEGFQAQVTEFPAAWLRGTCSFGGQQLGLNTYTDATVTELVRQQGGQRAYVTGDRWVVDAPTPEVAQQIAGKIGGTVST